MNKTLGLFLSDIHLPDNIELKPVLEYAMDFAQRAKEEKAEFVLILGGDILDAKGMHGVESMAASQIKMSWYERDTELLRQFLTQLQEYTGKTGQLIYLEGNHEERYTRIMKRYPDAFADRFDFMRDVVVKLYPKAKWVPYGTYKSYYQLGDCVFTHGTIYPENHAKKYASVYSPYKVVYGHLHHFQAFTIHNAMPTLPAHYAVTAGCLTHLAPEWKKGAPHMWQLGFCDFVSIGGITTPTAHVINNRGIFHVGGKLYGGK